MVVVSWVSHYNDGGIMSSGGELTCSMGMPGNSRIASIEEQMQCRSSASFPSSMVRPGC